MRKALIVLVTMTAIALSGCASFNQQGMNAKAAAEIKGQTVHLVTPPVKVGVKDSAQITSSANDAVRYVIDAKTINWSIGYFPTDWTHYRTIYTAKARLINVQTKDVVAEGFCKHIPESNVNAPTYDDRTPAPDLRATAHHQVCLIHSPKCLSL